MIDEFLDQQKNALGLVKWYADDKGYGVASLVNSKDDIFLHFSNSEDKANTYILQENDILIFQIEIQKGKSSAVKWRYFDYSYYDFELFYNLAKKLNCSLYAYDNRDKKIVLSNFLKTYKLSNFLKLLKDKYKDIKNNEYIDQIRVDKELFSTTLINKDFVDAESLIRFNSTDDIKFKKDLIKNDFISLYDIDLDFIWDNYTIDVDFFYQLKNHPNIVDKIVFLLEKTNDHQLYKEILFFAIEKDVQNINDFIKKYIENIEVENIITQYSELFNLINKSTVNYKTTNEEKNKIYETNDLDFIFKMYKEKVIDFESDQLKQTIIYFIDNNKHSAVIDKIINFKAKFDEIDIDFDIIQELKSYILTLENNYDLVKEAFQKNIIDFEDADFFGKYIVSIDLDIFKKITKDEISEKNILLLFEKNQNQELIKYLIIDFENLVEKICSEFLNIGVKKLSSFSEENQVLYLKKLFHLKSLNKINFTQNDLCKFNDINLLKEASNNSKNIDFSTYLMIDLLAKFSNKNGFLATHELLKSVLNIIQFSPTKKVKISNFFDECNGLGKEVIKDKDEVVTKTSFRTANGEFKYYFKIEFPYSSTIVEDIKKIPGRKYNQDAKFWGAPLRSENEVIAFAKKHSFLLKLNNNSYYSDNLNLITIEKSLNEIPKGIEFCCGQESQKNSYTGNKFWWCNQSQCFQNNIKTHNDWKEYTLFDFANILNFNLTENSRDGNFSYEIGLYTRFVTFLNRFNRLLDRLYCKECDHVLYPTETSNFNKYSVTKFECKNSNCSNHNNTVYLNNCLNGQCNNIIDSRESKKCNNNWYICNECGSCCSHVAFERRLQNLNTNGGEIYDRLVELIHNKSGHLEKAEYFCYKCGQFMTEHSQTLYKCVDCQVEYDLSNYNHILKKQIHLQWRDQHYPNRTNYIRGELKRQLLLEKNIMIEEKRPKNQIFGILFNKVINIDGNDVCLKDLNDKKLTNEIFD